MNIRDVVTLAIICLGLVVALYVVAILILATLRWRRLLRRITVTLQLTPPAGSTKSIQATKELFSVLHGLRSSRSHWQRLLRRDVTFSLSIDSTKAEGVRYLAELDARHLNSFCQLVTSYVPQMKIKEIARETLHDPEVMSFRQTGHYAFPLADTLALDSHDPLSYLVGTLTNLNNKERVRIQLIVTPVRLNEAALLSRKVLGNEDMLSHLAGRNITGLLKPTRIITAGLFAITDTTGEIFHGTTKTYYGNDRMKYEKLQVAKRQRPARTLSAFELELMETMHRKLTQPLFRVSLRVGVSIDDPEKLKQRTGSIKSAMQSYSVPSYQSLRTRWNLKPVQRLRGYAFQHGLPALFKKSELVFSSSELASFYHVPPGTNTQTDNLVASLSKTLPAPISLKQDSKLDVVFGVNTHHGVKTPFGLTAIERERHVYIIGGTGNGKTTMIQYAIVQDIKAGKGLAVIDPHGDMAETLLRYVPEERIKDVVYFNPDDLEYPIGLNLLELTPGLTGHDLLREKDIITESVVSVFRKIFSEEDTGGHRIEYVLRNTIQTALTVPDATLFTVFQILNDSQYRKKIIAKLDDQNLINFWKNELGKAGDMQKVKMSAGITSKIGRFLFSASARQILEQPHSTIDFDDIINSGKILICNFSKGLIGEDTSELFGITVLAKLQLASLRRARIQQADRRAFHLYVDEFQNFATQSFVQMLSESRKYKLFMTMAEQSTSQQKEQQMVNIILANVGTVICFRTGNPHDEQQLLPLFTPYVDENEISNLSAFNFYAKLSAVKAQEPLSGETILLTDTPSNDVAESVIAYSRKTYATKNEIEELESTKKTQKVAKPQKNKSGKIKGVPS